MRIHFTKMHGLGNDFVVVDNTRGAVTLDAAAIRRIADRRTGVGCDQLLVAEAPEDPETDFRMRIFNADGSEAEQCGNGVRCFASFVRTHRLTANETLVIDTAGGRVRATLKARGRVMVDMGPPRLEPSEIPFVAEGRAARYPLDFEGGTVCAGCISMGNPHAVLQVRCVEDAPVITLGAELQRHCRFPEGVNVGFMEIVDREHVRLRVFERGVGETLACGTGACAAVVVGRIQDLLDPDVAVELPGGPLAVSWHGEGHPVMMTGPSTSVFEGHIEV